MVLIHAPSNGRHGVRTSRSAGRERRARPVSPVLRGVTAGSGLGLADRGWALLWRVLDRVPAGSWRVTTLYLAGRYLVLLAAAAVVVVDPRGAASVLGPWREVGEVAVLLDGRPALATAASTTLLGWALVLLLRTLVARAGAARLADRPSVLLVASVALALLCTTPVQALALAGAAVVLSLLLHRRRSVR